MVENVSYIVIALYSNRTQSMIGTCTSQTGIRKEDWNDLHVMKYEDITD